MKPPAIELADVMRAFSLEYLSKYGDRMPAVHRKAIADITACRTPAMGGTTYYCPDCERWQYSYHSCGNRNCNKCGNERARHWLERTGKLLLATQHFMVTFTLPGELRRPARSHQRLFYGLLMQCAAGALQMLGWDPRFVGGRLAMMGVLHTWSRDLSYHPHAGMIVAGGGLWEAEGLWLEARQDFLVPVKALSVIFAAKFRDGLKKQAPDLYAQTDLSVWSRPWVVHSQPVGGGEAALKYLAQYVFRPALSNKRLVSMAGGNVTFRWQDSGSKRWKTTRLEPMEFIRRYLQHTLPRGFVKVRYYGLYAHRHRQRLNRLRGKLAYSAGDGETTPSVQAQATPAEAATAKQTLCPCCGRPMLPVATIPRSRPLSGWPNAPPPVYSTAPDQPTHTAHEL